MSDGENGSRPAIPEWLAISSVMISSDGERRDFLYLEMQTDFGKRMIAPSLVSRIMENRQQIFFHAPVVACSLITWPWPRSGFHSRMRCWSCLSMDAGRMAVSQTYKAGFLSWSRPLLLFLLARKQESRTRNAMWTAC